MNARGVTMRARWIGFAVAMLAVNAFGAIPARAADVNKTLVAFGAEFRDGSTTGTAPPTFVIAPGDQLLLRIENHDALFHTFTFPHFGIDKGLDNGSASQPLVIFVAINTTASDAGPWEFWCRPHSSGTDPEQHTGMVGHVTVSAPPKTPGFEVWAAIGAVTAAFVIVAVWRRQA